MIAGWLANTKRMGHAQQPLVQGRIGQYFINEQRGRLGHAPRTATGTDTAPLAAECDQVRGVAGVTAHV
jgi:hypothetical protein